MTIWTLLNNLLVLLGLIPCIGFAIHMSRIMAQKLPDQQRLALEQFARLAVRNVEQQYPKNPGKKALAMASVASLFKAFGLPVPPFEAVDIAIEAAVQELPQLNEPIMNG